MTELRARRRDSSTMTFFAPRIVSPLLEALVSVDTPDVPIAEINRRLGERAEELGLRRPSYQRVRELVHELRELARDGRPESVLDVVFSARLRLGFLEFIVEARVPKLRR